MSLASKLKELRLKRGESLQQVGDAVSVSKAHIWELEKGTSTNPGLELLKKLATHFNVTVQYLAEDKADEHDQSSLQFFREFGGKLSDKDWETLRVVADRLKDKESK
ncbi:helix-turn-helix transcriptional regulator [Hoeflea sp. EC-HK425]|uniref:helix-turn-helix domain-containing protein n=1 Tax=Hoeflea sp. EC-HK425 TaxID=2038388 RepID=UPI001256233F|nr:helix-turn-helix transcriptional regulator [Hoeflea sp. EC-HK425]VVS99479.1 putative transcriptional regulator [Hoeflea sp. EC-HK425]